MLLHAAMRASKNWAIAERSYSQPWPRVCHQRSSQHLQHRLTQGELSLVNGDLVQCSLDDSWRCRPCSMAFHRANSPRHSQNWLSAEVIRVSVDQEELSQGVFTTVHIFAHHPTCFLPCLPRISTKQTARICQTYLYDSMN